jgi:hypothetical protein
VHDVRQGEEIALQCADLRDMAFGGDDEVGQYEDRTPDEDVQKNGDLL